MYTNNILKKYIAKIISIIVIFIMLLTTGATCVYATTIEDLRGAYGMEGRLGDITTNLRSHCEYNI